MCNHETGVTKSIDGYIRQCYHYQYIHRSAVEFSLTMSLREFPTLLKRKGFGNREDQRKIIGTNFIVYIIII